MRVMLMVGFLMLTANLYSQDVKDLRKDYFKKLTWLEGMWTRTNCKAGQSGHERWERSSSGLLLGYGVSFKGSDTVFIEKLKIVEKENTLYYVADVPENREPVYFGFISLQATGFVCENAAHDFPKKISYQLSGNKLRVVISGDGKSSDYLFEKK